METSILIARLYGPVFLLVGIGMIINQEYYKETIEKISKNPVLLLLGGALALAAGTLVLVFHNIWEPSWRVLLTISGWASVLKGGMFLAFPTRLGSIRKMFTKTTVPYWGFFSAIFGSIFCYFGFLA